MKHALPLALTLCLASPALSEEDRGLSLMQRGAQLFMEGIMRELEPALDGFEDLGPALRGFAEEMGPALAELLSQVEDWSRYHPPEILPNGDIILRRKIEPVPGPESEPEGSVPSEPVDI
jgi:hypothetical protein